jgi:hypothetical protein
VGGAVKGGVVSVMCACARGGEGKAAEGGSEVGEGDWPGRAVSGRSSRQPL